MNIKDYLYKKMLDLKNIIDRNYDVKQINKAREDALDYLVQIKADKQMILKNIIDYYNYRPEEKEKYKKELSFLQEFGFSSFPYEFSNENHINERIIKVDENHERYIVHNGKKLYADVATYELLMIEQNDKSPHRYFTDKFKVEKEDTFLDLGAAEGLISLDVVDSARKVIMVECLPDWINSLEKTFKPYEKKVTLVNKYVSNTNDDTNITVDELLKNEKGHVFIKIDVEGFEDKVLDGMKETLNRSNIKIAICTYHKNGDFEKFKDLLEKNGFETNISEGYMTLTREPYFSKGLIRAWK